jgi:hypothetical protein
MMITHRVTYLARLHDDRWRSLRELQFLDWAFLGFGWLTTFWLMFNVFELFNKSRFLGEFDVMPVAAGLIMISLGWWALRLADRLDRTIDGLDEGAGLERTGTTTIEDFLNDFRRRAKLYAMCTGVFITALMICGFALFVLQQGDSRDLGTLFFRGLLGCVMVFTGYIIGSLLGRLVAYGTFRSAIEKQGFRFASLSTLKTRSAVAALLVLFVYATSFTMIFCHFAALWWIIWEFGYDPNHYRDQWEVFTLFIWAISFGLYFAAGQRPTKGFQEWIDQLYGGRERRNVLDQQLKEAEEDLRSLTASSEGSATSREALELREFIEDISVRRFRPALLNPRIFSTLVLWNALLFFLPLTWSLASAGVILNGKQFVGIHVGAVVADSAASLAGIRAGDIISEIDGQRVGPEDFPFMQRIVSGSAGRLLDFQIQRGRDRIELQATPRPSNGNPTIGVLGVVRSEEK